MFCGKYAPSCFLSASEGLAPTSVPPRQPATNVGLAPARWRRTADRGAERGWQEGAWPRSPPRGGSRPQWRRPWHAAGSVSPLLGEGRGPGQHAERVAASSELGRREVTTPGMRGPTQPRKDPAARRCCWKGAELPAPARRRAQIGACRCPCQPAERSREQHGCRRGLPPCTELSPCAFPQKEKPAWSSASWHKQSRRQIRDRFCWSPAAERPWQLPAFYSHRSRSRLLLEN